MKNSPLHTDMLNKTLDMKYQGYEGYPVYGGVQDKLVWAYQNFVSPLQQSAQYNNVRSESVSDFFKAKLGDVFKTKINKPLLEDQIGEHSSTGFCEIPSIKNRLNLLGVDAGLKINVNEYILNREINNTYKYIASSGIYALLEASTFKGGVVAVDTETMGVNENRYLLKCVSLSWFTNNQIVNWGEYFETSQEGKPELPLPISIVLNPRRFLDRIMIRHIISNANRLVFHNAPYDVPILYLNSLMSIDDVNKVYDTLVMASFCYTDRDGFKGVKFRKNLEDLIRVVLNLEKLYPELYNTTSESDEANSLVNIAKSRYGSKTKSEAYRDLDLDTPEYVHGAAADAAMTLHLFKPLLFQIEHIYSNNYESPDAKRIMSPEGNGWKTLLYREISVNQAMLRVACKGIKVDYDYQNSLENQYEKEKNDLFVEIKYPDLTNDELNKYLEAVENTGILEYLKYVKNNLKILNVLLDLNLFLKSNDDVNIRWSLDFLYIVAQLLIKISKVLVINQDSYPNENIFLENLPLKSIFSLESVCTSSGEIFNCYLENIKHQHISDKVPSFGVEYALISFMFEGLSAIVLPLVDVISNSDNKNKFLDREADFVNQKFASEKTRKSLNDPEMSLFYKKTYELSKFFNKLLAYIRKYRDTFRDINFDIDDEDKIFAGDNINGKVLSRIEKNVKVLLSLSDVAAKLPDMFTPILRNGVNSTVFDPDSPGTIAKEFVGHLGETGELPKNWPKTPTGSLSASKKHIQSLDHPTAKNLTKYREYIKIQNDYISKIERFSLLDGRLHPTVSILGASATGRMAYDSPAIQQLTGDARGMFISDVSEEDLYSIDWTSIEPVIAIYAAKDLKSIAIYENPDPENNDLYQTVATRANVTRKQAKVILLASFYGQGLGLLKNNLGLGKPEDMPSDFNGKDTLAFYSNTIMANKYLASKYVSGLKTIFSETLPEILYKNFNGRTINDEDFIRDKPYEIFGTAFDRASKEQIYEAQALIDANSLQNSVRNEMQPTFEWIDNIKKLAKNHQCVYTLDGRRLEVGSNLSYKGVNYVIQGTAYSILSDVIYRIKNTTLKGTPLSDKLKFAMHDELVIQGSEAIEIVKDIMETPPQWFTKTIGRQIKFRVDVERMGQRWKKV